MVKNNEKGGFRLVKLTNQLSCENNSPKMDQHTGGKWLIHGTKHHKVSQLQTLKLTMKNILVEKKNDIKEPDGNHHDTIRH